MITATPSYVLACHGSAIGILSAETNQWLVRFAVHSRSDNMPPYLSFVAPYAAGDNDPDLFLAQDEPAAVFRLRHDPRLACTDETASLGLRDAEEDLCGCAVWRDHLFLSLRESGNGEVLRIHLPTGRLCRIPMGDAPDQARPFFSGGGRIIAAEDALFAFDEYLATIYDVDDDLNVVASCTLDRPVLAIGDWYPDGLAIAVDDGGRPLALRYRRGAVEERGPIRLGAQKVGDLAAVCGCEDALYTLWNPTDGGPVIQRHHEGDPPIETLPLVSTEESLNALLEEIGLAPESGLTILECRSPLDS